MSKVITSQNIISALPYVLTKSDNTLALATVIADELCALYDSNELLAIYTKIDSLPEELLDILARDFKVDWFLYDGTLESKRAQLKTCFYVHRHFGTKGGIKYALSSLCPGTDIEEWFEYGGNPYYFRIVLDITEQILPIVQSEIIRIGRILKPCRCVLEDNGISYRSRLWIVVSVNSGFAFFNSRICGTYPKNAVHGKTLDSGMDVSDDGYSVDYSSRVCGWPLGSL